MVVFHWQARTHGQRESWTIAGFLPGSQVPGIRARTRCIIRAYVSRPHSLGDVDESNQILDCDPQIFLTRRSANVTNCAFTSTNSSFQQMLNILKVHDSPEIGLVPIIRSMYRVVVNLDPTVFTFLRVMTTGLTFSVA